MSRMILRRRWPINEPDEDRFADWSQILFDQALLSEGGQLRDPAGFVNKLNSLIVSLTD